MAIIEIIVCFFILLFFLLFFFFFFQAEDGIRDTSVTGVQTCALPILTNDTGTMHLASLLGVPTVAIFGSTEPRLTGPLGDRHIIVRHQVECSPCFLRECPIDFRCMKAVSVDEAINGILALLQRSAPSALA